MKNIEKQANFENWRENQENLFEILKEEGINDWQLYLKIAILSKIIEEVEKNGITVKEKYVTEMPGYEKLIDFLDKQSGNLIDGITEAIGTILKNNKFRELISKGDLGEIREKVVEPLVNDEKITKNLEELQINYNEWLKKRSEEDLEKFLK